MGNENDPFRISTTFRSVSSAGREKPPRTASRRREAFTWTLNIQLGAESFQEYRLDGEKAQDGLSEQRERAGEEDAGQGWAEGMGMALAWWIKSGHGSGGVSAKPSSTTAKLCDFGDGHPTSESQGLLLLGWELLGNNASKLPSVVAGIRSCRPRSAPIMIIAFGNSPNKMLQWGACCLYLS